MKPGATTSPSASTMRVPRPVASRSAAAIRPPAMATSPRRGAEPSPSWIVAPRKTVSIITSLARSIHEPAAVDVDGRSGHVGGAVGREEGDDGRDLRWLGVAPERKELD